MHDKKCAIQTSANQDLLIFSSIDDQDVGFDGNSSVLTNPKLVF